MLQPTAANDLGSQLSAAIHDYRVTWQPVDSELYDLCRRRPSQHDFADVFTKVAIIGRVYNAGLSRAWRGRGDPEAETAHCLMAHAPLLETALQQLSGVPLDRTSLPEIIGLHGAITRALKGPAGGRYLASAVSKYLHFHCPIVPIYDNQAAEHVKGFVEWQEAYHLRSAIAEPSDWSDVYYRFTTAFLVLYERASDALPTPPTVKEVDHLLWK